jgi:hypothetical protein
VHDVAVKILFEIILGHLAWRYLASCPLHIVRPEEGVVEIVVCDVGCTPLGVVAECAVE